MMTRRRVLAGLATFPAFSAVPSWAATPGGDGPIFSPSGPNADHYGAAEGFPVLRPLNDPDAPQYRVGQFSHFDEIMPTRPVKRAITAWNFERSPREIDYSYRGIRYRIEDYLDRNPVTGLIIAKDDQIFYEHYQYGRTDRERLLSQSMAKSIVGMLVGLAISDGAIGSVEDTADMYVPEFKGSEYGKTPLRDLLHMSSGVAFGEAEDNGRDLNRLWLDLMGGYLSEYKQVAKGTINGILQFNHRVAAPGTRFYYASIEADILGVVLRRATGKNLSDYFQEKIWSRIGTEADASWLVDAQGFEVAHGFFNAVLRDYARLGRLLAHDGAWEAQQIIPAQWITDATTLRVSDAYLAPGKGEATFGYGYLVWLLPWGERQFALFGDYGHRICVDPASKLILVHTAVDQGTEIWSLWKALVAQFGKV
jgi:CubicO group peptidase (beta-lactamase class C family)